MSYSFCATSTTIVSGALAERIYVGSYIVFSMIMTGLIYPIAAGWAWGDGWLARLGYHDFSGSGIVHIIGGIAGLAGTFIIGPRLGMFGKRLVNNNSANSKEEADNGVRDQSSISNLSSLPTPEVDDNHKKKKPIVTF